MKKNIIFTIIGIIIGTTITATAAYIYTARDIDYTPTDNNWNVSNVQDAINEIKTDVNNINDLVDQGDMLYPVGTNIVGLVADDTPYKDSNDKYILADSTTGKNMIDNVTYKSIASTETLKGEVGADTVIHFSSGELLRHNVYGDYKSGTTTITKDTISNSELVIISASSSADCGSSNWSVNIDISISGNYEVVSSNSSKVRSNTTNTASSSGKPQMHTKYLIIKKKKGDVLTITATGTTNYGYVPTTLEIMEF